MHCHRKDQKEEGWYRNLRAGLLCACQHCSQIQSQIFPSTVPSPAIPIEESCDCSHNLPISFLAWIFPTAPNWLKVLLQTPTQILGGLSLHMGYDHQTEKQKNTYTFILGCFGGWWLTSLSLWPRDAAWLGFAFCKLAGDAAPPQSPFPLQELFVLRNNTGWMLGQHGKAAVPSPQQRRGCSTSCQSTSSPPPHRVSRCTSGHEASGMPLPLLLIYELPAVFKDFFSSSSSWCNVGVLSARMRLNRGKTPG